MGPSRVAPWPEKLGVKGDTLPGAVEERLKRKGW